MRSGHSRRAPAPALLNLLCQWAGLGRANCSRRGEELSARIALVPHFFLAWRRVADQIEFEDMVEAAIRTWVTAGAGTIAALLVAGLFGAFAALPKPPVPALSTDEPIEAGQWWVMPARAYVVSDDIGIAAAAGAESGRARGHDLDQPHGGVEQSTNHDHFEV